MIDEYKWIEKLPVTNDRIYDLSWFIEGAAYSCGGDSPRRQGFEKKLRVWLKERGLTIMVDYND